MQLVELLHKGLSIRRCCVLLLPKFINSPLVSLDSLLEFEFALSDKIFKVLDPLLEGQRLRLILGRDLRKFELQLTVFALHLVCSCKHLNVVFEGLGKILSETKIQGHQLLSSNVGHVE